MLGMLWHHQNIFCQNEIDMQLMQYYEMFPFEQNCIFLWKMISFFFLLERSTIQLVWGSIRFPFLGHRVLKAHLQQHQYYHQGSVVQGTLEYLGNFLNYFKKRQHRFWSRYYYNSLPIIVCFYFVYFICGHGHFEILHWTYNWIFSGREGK